MTKKVRIGILGCANIAERYAIRAFQTINNAEVKSIASRSEEKAGEWAKKFNIPKSENYTSLIKNTEIDAVYIPLPIGLHKEWVLKAAKNGKHILCEKSLAPSFNDVKEIIKVCNENEVILYENFTCDYHPQHQTVLKLIKEGKIGKPSVFQSFYGFPIINNDNFRYDKKLGGSALNESGSYQVYTARKLFGEPLSVFADIFFDKKTGVDMHGNVSLQFKHGVSAQFSFDLDAIYQNNYSVWGSAGLIKVGRAYAIAPTFKPEISLIKNENRQEKIMAIDVPAHNHFETIFHDFCDTVLNKDKQKIENVYINILNQAKTLEAIRVSSKEKRKVWLKEIK